MFGVIAIAAFAAGAVGPVGMVTTVEPARDGGAEAPAARIEVAVDDRVELFSVLERLAGRPEYGVASTPYARAVDEWFAPYAGAPAVASFRELHGSHGIGYDAAMTLAVQLDDGLTPLVPLSPRPDGLDPRWDGVDLDIVLDDVRDFAAETRFDDFLVSQRSYVDAVEAAMGSFIESRPLGDWFEEVFGPRQHLRSHVVPGLLTGQMSYGVHSDGDGIYAIMSLESPDALGIPVPGLLTEEYVVHEFAHSYVNPVVREHVEVFVGTARSSTPRRRRWNSSTIRRARSWSASRSSGR